MRSHGKYFAVLALCLIAVPAWSAPGDGAPETATLIKELQLQIKKLQDSLDDLKKQLNEVPSESSVDAQVRKALAGPAADIYTLKSKVEQLQKDVASLKGTSGSTRVSGYPASSTGRIRLLNTFPTQMGVILNGQFYRLAPGEERVLQNQPAGAFTYEVVGAAPPQPGQVWPLSRTLTPNELFTITVYPR